MIIVSIDTHKYLPTKWVRTLPPPAVLDNWMGSGFLLGKRNIPYGAILILQ